MLSYVPRAEYDNLKAKYDALVASGANDAGYRSQRPIIPPTLALTEEERGQSVTPAVDDSAPRTGRKKRSIRLEVSLICGELTAASRP
jgi:hypothetical protein